MLVRVLVFYILTFVFTIVLGGAQEAANLSAETIILPQWGPGLAALVMLLIFRKDRFRITFFDRKVPASRYLLAALIPISGAVLVYLIYRLFFGAPASVACNRHSLDPVALVSAGSHRRGIGLARLLAQAFEPGLAGLISSVIVGTLWALWHVGMYQNGALYMAFFVLLMISYTFVIYALVASIGFNVLVAAVFHMMINVANLFTYSIVNQVEFMMVSSLVWAAIAVGVVLTRRSLFLTRRGTDETTAQSAPIVN